MTGLATPIPRLTAAMLMQLREEISQACAVLVRWIVVSGASSMPPNNQLLGATKMEKPAISLRQRGLLVARARNHRQLTLSREI